jgi:hypothetical protein
MTVLRVIQRLKQIFLGKCSSGKTATVDSAELVRMRSCEADNPGTRTTGEESHQSVVNSCQNAETENLKRVAGQTVGRMGGCSFSLLFDFNIPHTADD